MVMTRRQHNYSRGNAAILDALKKNDRDRTRAYAAFMQEAVKDPEIIREALDLRAVGRLALELTAPAIGLKVRKATLASVLVKTLMDQRTIEPEAA
jgi:hypothetical protein